MNNSYFEAITTSSASKSQQKNKEKETRLKTLSPFLDNAKFVAFEINLSEDDFQVELVA